MKKHFLWAAMALSALTSTMTFAACSGDGDDEDSSSTETIAVTESATDVTYDSATLTGSVNRDLLPVGSSIEEFGMEISDDISFSEPHRIAASDFDADGLVFCVKAYPLSPSKTYYYRSFVCVSSIYYYGIVKWFITQMRSSGAHVAVDLGLPSGTLWADCNVGANAPEETGDYFAWGETSVKDVYDWNNYPLWKDKDGDNKQDKDEFVDIGSDIAGTDYDVAHVLWGDGWRMPTEEQCKELVENTISGWTNLNGKNGFRLRGKNGNSIFLPAAGIWRDSGLLGAGSCGFFWSSTLNESSPHIANSQNFGVGDGYGHDFRCYGRTIRPVYKR